MSEVMQTWSVTVLSATHADPARQRVEIPVDLFIVKPDSRLETNRYDDTERPPQ